MKLNKGSALIIAVMITLILSITAAGFMYITNWTTNQATKGHKDLRLFWSAESGANHALKWIKRLKPDYFGKSDKAVEAKDHFNETATLKNFKLYETESVANQINVDLNLGYDPATNSWSVTSIATDHEGRKCQIKLTKIEAVNPAKFSYGLVTDEMARNKRFWNGDLIDGELYSSGGLNFGPSPVMELRPHFNSKVSLAKSYGESLTPNDANRTQYAFTTSYSEKLNNWMDNVINSGLDDNLNSYANGLYACKGGNKDTEIKNEAEFKEVMADIFPSGIEIVDKIDPTNGVCYSWDDFQPGNCSKEIKPYVVPKANFGANKGDKIRILFKVKSDGTPVANIYSTKYNQADNKDVLIKSLNLTEYNTILVPECASAENDKDKYAYVEVEGTIGADACIVTQNNDVVVVGDLKYNNIDYPDSYFNIDLVTAAQTAKAKAIQSEIDSEAITPKLSMITGIGEGAKQGDVWVWPKNKDIENVIISAAIFSPVGMFGGFKQSNWSGTKNYKFKTINFGSVLMYDKGGWHGFGNGDITPNFYDDLRYKNSNIKPLGYISTVGQGLLGSGVGMAEEINTLNYGYNWEVTWL